MDAISARDAWLGCLLVLAGCDGSDPFRPPSPDAGPGGPGGLCTERQIELQTEVGAWLEETCSHAGCHGPVGARVPYVSAADLPELVEAGYITPGDPTSGLMRRINPENPTLIMPPTRHENPPEAVAAIEEWILLGARTDCVELPPRPLAAPNSLDQDELFVCTTPTAFAPELALMGHDELMHRVGGYLGDAPLQGTPLPVDGAPFSTATIGATLDATLLGLHLDVLDSSRSFRISDRNPDFRVVSSRRGMNEANRLWQRSLSADETARIACLTDGSNAAADLLADEACKRDYVSLLLERYAMQRRPTDAEVDELVAFLDDELAMEASGGRLTTQDHLVEASMVMFGTLHRSLIGDDTGALTPDEWGPALAATLGTTPMNTVEIATVARPEMAWVDDFRTRRDAGQLDTTADARAYISSVLELEAGYVGGEFPASLERARPDVFYDDRTQSSFRRPRRGRFWLAPRIAAFFREYFDYGAVSTMAKDAPAATSRWDREWISGSARGGISGGYTIERDGANPNRPPHGEPPMVDQLDDFIAREVVMAERSGQDVFRALMTGRTYRLPASLTNLEGFDGRGVRSTGACDPMVCSDASCCPSGGSCMLTSFGSDGTPIGECLGLSFRQFHYLAAVYDHGPIEESEAASLANGDDPTVAMDPANEARWVEMESGVRSGVLTHPTWLTMFGANEETGPSAIHRGRWIREHLFCEDVAGLELVNLQAQLADAEDGQRARDRIVATFGDLSLPASERSSPEPLCANAACHGRMNELGLAFETFNHAGFNRFDDHGHVPDGHALILDWPGQRDPVEIDDATQLTELLADDPHARRCFLRHVFRFFAGRYETPADACLLAEMETAFASGSFLAAVEALMTSESFLVRSEREVGR
ncbi:MAG: DUF1588 domain-containing protein [Sandaracinaceae bacterium]